MTNTKPEIIFDFSSYYTHSYFTDDITLQFELDPSMADLAENIYFVNDTVTFEAGTYGAEDAELGKAHGIETFHTVDLKGTLQSHFPGGGKFVKDADKEIIKDLRNRELLFKDAWRRNFYT